MDFLPQYSLRTLIGLVAIVSMLLAVAAYALSPARFYNPDQITLHVEGVYNDGIEIQYSTLPETLFYCPGVNLNRNGELIDVYFHRVRIESKTPDLEIPAIKNSNGTYSIKIPFDIAAGEPAQLRLNGTKELGRWQRTN